MSFGLISNCGIITPTVFENIVCQVPGVDITHNRVPFFHRMMCQWAYSVPMVFDWVIVIEAENKDNLLQQIKQTVPSFEPSGWNIGRTVDDTWNESTQDIIGCIFAQAVDIPGETTSVERVGVSEGSRRGFINAPIISGRGDFGDLTITFLETNRSFADGVIRPWNILISHKGLIAQAQSIKSTIHVYELAKLGACTPNIIRKHWVFKGAAPVGISPESKTQSSSSDYGKRQTTFVFNSYYIDDHTASNNPVGDTGAAFNYSNPSVAPITNNTDTSTSSDSPLISTTQFNVNRGIINSRVATSIDIPDGDPASFVENSRYLS